MAAGDPEGAVDESAETRVEPDAQTRVQPDAAERRAPPSPSPSAADDPLRIGRYTVLRRLGHGGMGVVYAAYDGELDRKVAIKVIVARHRGGSIGRARMQREAQALAKLSHPNVVQVFEVGDLDGRVYLAMEYVQGPTLKRWLRERPRAWPEIIAVYLEAGRGLTAAHAAGLIHRDFKPTNAIVGDDGRVRVLDFGLARVELAGDGRAADASRSASASARPRTRPGAGPREALTPALTASQSIHPSSVLVSEITEAGTLLGTPAYMAPEQLDRLATDARGDLFSFCVALWEALYGARPFVGRDDRELRLRIAAGPPPAPRGVPAAIGRALRRGLAEDPGERPKTMAALLDELERAARRGRRLVVGVGLSAALAAACGLTLLLAQRAADSTAARCDAAADLAGVYDPAIAREIEAALAAAGPAYAARTWEVLAPRLQAHAAALTQARRQSCLAVAAAAAADAPLLAAQTLCLDRRRSELAALTSVLRRADAAAGERALATLDALGPLDRCLDLDELRRALDRRGVRVEPGDMAAVAAIEARLAEANVERLAEHLDRGQALAGDALGAAERLDHPGLVGQALLRIGQLHELAGEYADAREALLRAHAAAERAGDDRLAVEVATALLRVDGTDLRELAPALVWREVAAAKLARAGDDPGQRLHLLLEAGVALIEGGKRQDAAPLFREALALAEARRGESPRIYVSALNIFAAGVLQPAGELAEAEATMQRALDLQVEITGDDHPYAGMLIYNLGTIRLLRGDLRRARADFERALAIRERAYGPDHPEVAQSLTGLGAVLGDLGDDAAAIPHLQRSLAIDERARGADHPELIYALNLLATSLSFGGRFDEAEAALRRARRILDDRGLQESGPSVLIDTGLARLALARGRPTDARDLFQRALGRAERHYSADHAAPAELRLELADVALDLGNAALAAELLARAAPILVEADEYGPDLIAHLALIRLRLADQDPAAAEGARRRGREALDALLAAPTPDRQLVARFRAWLGADGL